MAASLNIPVVAKTARDMKTQDDCSGNCARRCEEKRGKERERERERERIMEKNSSILKQLLAASINRPFEVQQSRFRLNPYISGSRDAV